MIRSKSYSSKHSKKILTMYWNVSRSLNKRVLLFVKRCHKTCLIAFKSTSFSLCGRKTALLRSLYSTNVNKLNLLTTVTGWCSSMLRQSARDQKNTNSLPRLSTCFSHITLIAMSTMYDDWEVFIAAASDWRLFFLFPRVLIIFLHRILELELELRASAKGNFKVRSWSHEFYC